MEAFPPSSDNSHIPSRILESITDAFFALDHEWRFTYINAHAERLLQRERNDLLGKDFWTEFPAAVGTITENEYRRAVREQVVVAFDRFSIPLNAWFAIRAYPFDEGLSVFFQDITALKKAAEKSEQARLHERFLADLAERARRLTDPDEVIADAVHSVGRFLNVSRCVFADIDIQADTCTVPPDYCAAESTVSMAGTFPISAFGAIVVAEYEAGRAVVVNDVHADTSQVPEHSVAAYDAVGIRAHIGVPVVHSDRVVSCIGVHSDTPRVWKPEEVELLQAVVERTWLTVEVTRQNRALVRSAEERRDAHERTARTLESIADMFVALDKDWRFTYVNRQAEALWGRSHGELLGKNVWEEFPQAVGTAFDIQLHRAAAEGVAVPFEEYYPPLEAWLDVRVYPSEDGLSVYFQNVSERKAKEDERKRLADANSLLLDSTGEGIYGIDLEGCFTFVNLAAAQMLGFTQGQMVGQAAHALIHHTRPDGLLYPVEECPIYHAVQTGERVHSDSEVFWREDGTSFPIEFSAAPIVELGRVQGAVVTFADISERKALEREREYLVLREHRIADQLQAALQPPLPQSTAGMKVTKYYEAALDEAGVGGDFYNVFPIDKGCTALIIGDLSGKGLAAAAQVATVQNMLRYAIVRSATFAGAITELNGVLVEQGLLTGFATLFIGAYDSGRRRLTYVNCGQEPSLIRRSVNGDVEFLPPTGPILGSFDGGVFEEVTVPLNSGDALIIFTDGLTEVGRSRREMLGIEGVAALLRQTVIPEEARSAEAVAEHLALSLVSGVDAASMDGVMRDDICLMVGVVE